MRTVKAASSLAPDAVLLLLGGKWPNGRGFEWSLVEEFRYLSPGTLQGFHDGEPIGPALRFSVSEIDWRGRPVLFFAVELSVSKHLTGIDIIDNERTRVVTYQGKSIGRYDSRLGSHPEIVARFVPTQLGQSLGLQYYAGLTITKCLDYLSTKLNLSESDRLATLEALGSLEFHEVGPLRV